MPSLGMVVIFMTDLSVRGPARDLPSYLPVLVIHDNTMQTAALLVFKSVSTVVTANPQFQLLAHYVSILAWSPASDPSVAVQHTHL